MGQPMKIGHRLKNGSPPRRKWIIVIQRNQVVQFFNLLKLQMVSLTI